MDRGKSTGNLKREKDLEVEEVGSGNSLNENSAGVPLLRSHISEVKSLEIDYDLNQ